MKKNWKFATMALIAGVSLFATSCSSDEDPVNNPGDGGEDTYVLDSDITENATLETGKTYTLNGGVHVKSGATLTIQPGVTIVAQHDETVDYILVGSINSIFYFLHKAAEPFNCLEQDNLA